ncbi:hypothetical protein K438DRAFT_1929058 [Mycena galopus ATCC 62051]|nr:hypothetical protein K438DRAFT_1929058 [Mycena galopus ATCC 62051]
MSSYLTLTKIGSNLLISWLFLSKQRTYGIFGLLPNLLYHNFDVRTTGMRRRRRPKVEVVRIASLWSHWPVTTLFYRSQSQRFGGNTRLLSSSTTAKMNTCIGTIRATASSNCQAATPSAPDEGRGTVSGPHLLRHCVSLARNIKIGESRTTHAFADREKRMEINVLNRNRIPDMKAEKTGKKRKMRSLVPHPQPLPRAAPPVSSVRRHAALSPSKPSMDRSPEVEAAWHEFGEKLAEITSRTEAVDSEDPQQRAEHEEEMDRLWDRLMTQVLDDMSPLERRQFLLEQRAELEWSSRSAYAEPLIVDWSSSTAEYIDQ